MSGFVLHPEALTDLDEIWEYIAADNPGAADGILEEIYEAIRALVPFPQQGMRHPPVSAPPALFHILWGVCHRGYDLHSLNAHFCNSLEQLNHFFFVIREAVGVE
jgi:plasmid stabilization system protein ParE